MTRHHRFCVGQRVRVAAPDSQTAPEWRGRDGVVAIQKDGEWPSPAYVVTIDGRDVMMFERELAEARP